MPDKPKPEVVPVSMIRTDGDTQVRVRMRPETTNDYRELYEAAWERAAEECPSGGDIMEHFEFPLPPVTLFYDGKYYWVGDGFHRTEAIRLASIPVINAVVLQGSQRDARLHGIGSNAEHGLPRTNEDKQNAVRALFADPEWSQMGPTTMAQYARVSRQFVYNVQRMLDAEAVAALEAQMAVEEVQDDQTPAEVDATPAEPAERSAEAPVEATVETPPAEVAAGSDAELGEDDWMMTIPIYAQVLRHKGHGGREFREDALAWRALHAQRTLSVFKRETQAVIDFKEGGSTHLRRMIIDAARIPHPSQWRLCPTCKGVGTPCRCGAGYNVYIGIEVLPEEAETEPVEAAMAA